MKNCMEYCSTPPQDKGTRIEDNQVKNIITRGLNNEYLGLNGWYQEYGHVDTIRNLDPPTTYV